MKDLFKKLESENYQSNIDNKSISEIYNILNLTDREIILSLSMYCQALKCEIIQNSFTNDYNDNGLTFQEDESFAKGGDVDDIAIIIYIIKLLIKLGFDIKLNEEISFGYISEGEFYFDINLKNSINKAAICFYFNYGCGVNCFGFDISELNKGTLHVNNIDDLNNIIEKCYLYLNDSFSLLSSNEDNI